MKLVNTYLLIATLIFVNQAVYADDTKNSKRQPQTSSKALNCTKEQIILTTCMMSEV